MNSEITDRFHRENKATTISKHFLSPENVTLLVHTMEEEASKRKQTYGGMAVPTSYTIDEVYPLFESFALRKRFHPDMGLNEAFLNHHVQLFIANDVQHWRYAFDRHNRKQLTDGYLQTQTAFQPFRRRQFSRQPVMRPQGVRKKKVGRMDGFVMNLNSEDRRKAAMKEAGFQ